jgi:hypothetical protein
VKGQRFESLEEAQAYLDRWDQRWADTRIHGHDETAGLRPCSGMLPRHSDTLVVAAETHIGSVAVANFGGLMLDQRKVKVPPMRELG